MSSDYFRYQNNIDIIFLFDIMKWKSVDSISRCVLGDWIWLGELTKLAVNSKQFVNRTDFINGIL